MSAAHPDLDYLVGSAALCSSSLIWISSEIREMKLTSCKPDQPNPAIA
jgi:hypothetical protein